MRKEVCCSDNITADMPTVWENNMLLAIRGDMFSECLVMCCAQLLISKAQHIFSNIINVRLPQLYTGCMTANKCHNQFKCFFKTKTTNRMLLIALFVLKQQHVCNSLLCSSASHCIEGSFCLHFMECSLFISTSLLVVDCNSIGHGKPFYPLN